MTIKTPNAKIYRVLTPLLYVTVSYASGAVVNLAVASCPRNGQDDLVAKLDHSEFSPCVCKGHRVFRGGGIA